VSKSRVAITAGVVFLSAALAAYANGIQVCEIVMGKLDQ
jgi:hypothetical protein